MSEQDRTPVVEETVEDSAGDPTGAPETDAESAGAPGGDADVAADLEGEAHGERVGERGDELAEDADDEADEGDDEGGRPSRLERLENEGEIAADYLEELLDIADLDGDLDMDVEGDRAAVSIVGADLAQLVGRNGEVLDALQELTRLAVYRETGERSRLMLDISNYRAERRETLVALAEEKVAEVRETGEPASLEPMSSFERKIVHDVVTAAGLVSESEGAEPRRYVVISRD